MKQHSDQAWQIAALYSHVLASETRDLAAHIDVALQKQRDLLAECERALLEISDATAGSEHPTCISVGILSRTILAKLRAQEKDR